MFVMRSSIVWFLFVISWVSNFAQALKILGVYPTSYKSHINFNNAVLRTLAKNGHQVTMISPFRECAKENYTYIDTSNQTQLLVDAVGVDEFSYIDTTTGVYFILHDELQLCYDFVKLPEIQKAFKANEKPYDLIFVEILTMYPCFITLAQKWKIPVIGTITLPQWNYADHAIDNPRHPAYIGDEIALPNFYESFYGRLANTINWLIRIYLLHYEIQPKLEKFFNDEFGRSKDQMNLQELKPSLIFYNGHSSITPRPMNPNAIEIAGVHLQEPKSLPKDLQKFIDESKHGVILFSLGSVVKSNSFSKKIQNALLQAFANIPQRVIWKFESALENTPDNVLIMKWLPQRDILAHKNVRAFISHCGLSGSYEAIYEGVPVISMPIFGDQKINAANLEKHGTAFHLDKDSITKESALEALNAIINDTRYMENMKELSRKFKDRPIDPQHSVLYWTEYVHRHNGAPHLRTAAASLNWFQYLLLDVLSFVIATSLFVLITLKFLLRKLHNVVYKLVKGNTLGDDTSELTKKCN